MEKKSLIKALLEEQIEFCYTQSRDIFGISKDAWSHKFGKLIPLNAINMLRNKHGVEVIYSFDDDVYMYVKEIK